MCNCNNNIIFHISKNKQNMICLQHMKREQLTLTHTVFAGMKYTEQTLTKQAV